MRTGHSARRAGCWAAALAAASALCAAGHARAQERSLQAPYFAAKLITGVGGAVETAGPIAARTDDLEPSWGAGLQYMARLHRHFAVGALLSFQSWQSDRGSRADRDRNLAIDGAVVPAGVLPINRDFELYAAAGLALGMDVIGDLAVALEVSGIDPDPGMAMEIDEAFGFVLLPVLGARLAVSQDVGVLAEVGYSLRWYEHELIVRDERNLELARVIPFDVSFGQLTLSLGVFF